jgi:hypothetical protein
VIHETSIVVGERLFQVVVDSSCGPRSMMVTIKNGNTEWKYDEPGWQTLRYGVAEERFYLWSARRLISFSLERSHEPELVYFDEDLVTVFRRAATWVAVCETSVRLIKDKTEISRVELGDVVANMRLDGDVLWVVDSRGAEVRVDL